MRLRGELGSTLLETLVGAVLTTILVLVAFGSLAQAQRTVQGMAVRGAARTTLTTALHLLQHDLEGLTGPDMVVMDSARLVYRAWRGAALVCGRSFDGLVMDSARVSAVRLPAVGRDSLAVYVTDGAGSWWWRRVPLDGPPRAQACPDGSPGLVLPATISDSVPLRTPLRVFEVVEVRLYQSGGEWWLGARSISAGEVIQPAAGPLARRGLAFRYLDAFGNPASGSSDLHRVVITLTSTHDDDHALGGAASSRMVWRDSLVGAGWVR